MGSSRSLWLQELAKPMVIDHYIQLVFQRYWVEGRSIDTSDSISEILQRMDFDARDFLPYLEKDSDLALLVDKKWMRNYL